MNAVQQTQRMQNDARKEAREQLQCMGIDVFSEEYREKFDFLYQRAFDSRRRQFLETTVIAADIIAQTQQIFRNARNANRLALTGTDNEPLEKHWYIMIKPREEYNHPYVMHEFFLKLYAKPWINIHFATYEQNGKTPEQYGVGCHLNIICSVTKRSMAELKRAIEPIFVVRFPNGEHSMNAQSIDYNHLKTRKDYNYVKQRYLIDYFSNDGHKQEMKEHDYQWRHNMNLPHDITQGLNDHTTNIVYRASQLPNTVQEMPLISFPSGYTPSYKQSLYIMTTAEEITHGALTITSEPTVQEAD